MIHSLAAEPADAELPEFVSDALLDGQADMVMFVREPFLTETAAFVPKFGYQMTLVNVAG